MIDMSPAAIRHRFNGQVSERKVAEHIWQNIERFIRPWAGEFFREVTDEQSVEWNRPDIFDGVGMQANILLASNLHGSLVPAYTKWFNITFGNPELMDHPEAREWIEHNAELIWHSLLASNFNREIAEAFLDLTTWGNCFMFQERTAGPAWNNVTFRTLPLRESYFEEDSEGNIYVYYRHLRMTPIQMVSQFGLDALPPSHPSPGTR